MSRASGLRTIHLRRSGVVFRRTLRVPGAQRDAAQRGGGRAHGQERGPVAPLIDRRAELLDARLPMVFRSPPWPGRARRRRAARGRGRS